MNLIAQFIAFVLTRLFSAGLERVSSQYPCQEFFIVEKKDDLDSLINALKCFGESNRWKLTEIKTREGARIIIWVGGGFWTSLPRTVGLEVRESPDKFYIWVESRYNKSQMINRGGNKENIETLKTFFSRNYKVVPINLTWEEATKQIPLK